MEKQKNHIFVSNLVDMKKLIFSLLVFFISFQFISAQQKELIIKKGDKGLYIDHKVGAKESFFSIGRLYNVHPKHISAFNKLDITKGLLINQEIHIPLSDTNFIQEGNNGIPVYYITGEGEGLMKVSSIHGNVSLANLRNWNNLNSDKIKSGSKLIVGFFNSKEMPAITSGTMPKAVVPVVKNDEKPVVAEPIKEIIANKPEEKPILTTPKKAEKVIATSDQGYFKFSFDQQIRTSPVSKNETVTAGIFKTASGWQDGKYYLLIDRVPPGTIVKVINPVNNKVVFAKVLGEMFGIRQNEGLNIRISNAAAAMLEISELDKFIVKVNY